MARNPETPFHYSKLERKIWSIGLNHKDDGGPDEHLVGNEDSNNDEIVMRIPNLIK